ncbi:hypothetical protein CALVIDRAFT_541243 [Calocera viscosa TUFC12733]|uniref:DUF2423 domain-containing protein n=1 Tax=Calocera viscosa (strain TUFC12733) TaxID=1330018 RepID=A0A167I1M3_CALVF|nr:hypothetical protein CALVIDRAFT_541243 [Calocera viscosa TUFC12733]
MAKGLRSKVKRSFRRAKREDSVYAATHAARVNRLHSKLARKLTTDTDGDLKMFGEEGQEADDAPGWSPRSPSPTPAAQHWAYTCLGLVNPEEMGVEGVRPLRSTAWEDQLGWLFPSQN